MNNQLTTDQLKELLEIQKEFDSRIPTLNLQDSKVAYVVEFFEWFNTLETFKNWKKKPGKPLDIQLDELADLLAFGLSIANQQISDYKHFIKEVLLWFSVDSIDENYLKDTSVIYNFMNEFVERDSAIDRLVVVFKIAEQLYSIDQLITAYKKKMERNHARQDGKIDKDKGYV